MARPRLVVASVGTDHHPFDRLVEWMDRWAAKRPEIRVIVQRGTAATTQVADSEVQMDHGELCDLFALASAVVIHGGPSTVMDARAAGRLPIVVPRSPDLGEHVDRHQQRFGRHLARHGLARVAHSRSELNAALAEALADPAIFKVAVDPRGGPGVLAFGREVDALLGVETPIDAGLPSPPAHEQADVDFDLSGGIGVGGQ